MMSGECREFRKRVYRVRATVACSRVPDDHDPRKAVFGGATGVTGPVKYTAKASAAPL
jgi:hypothetical protein